MSFLSRPPALKSTCEPSGPRIRPTSRGDRVVLWAPARCTTWHIVCISWTTSWRSAALPSTRSAPRDTAGGGAPFQSAESHSGWSRAGWGPCGAKLIHKFISLSLSSDRHERDWPRGAGNKSEGVAQSLCPLCSVLKFSKCLRRLPSILQDISEGTRSESERDWLHCDFFI